ncbi:NGFI-A-binding protein homolog [Lucilia cuprina]|uniref:NGFI-A-binding protein homolog n=1 Tax=Lucilia cuprina TaxID=7375 RepID=UPI001F05CF2C|nr:NGFI-A-binding protein homolog [Lucilia cuprina]
MESVTGNSQNSTTAATTSASSTSSASISTTSLSSALSLTTTASLTQSSTAACSTVSASPASISSTSNLTSTGNLTSVTSAALVAAAAAAAAAHHHQQQQQPPHHTSLLQILPLDTGNKQDDSNNLSLASGLSEGQRSLSAAPSASSSPILSPPGKLYGRNANGTMVATSRPGNEAEIQLYRVLQKASLLAYYDTLLEMGGDDVQQLYEAGEEEFLEIMALVGMASKPLHVRRLQKALHEWALNPSQFQQGLSSSSAQFDTPAKPPTMFNLEAPLTASAVRAKFPAFNATAPFNPTPLINTHTPVSSAHLLTQICSLPSLPAHNPSTHILPPTTHINNPERPLAIAANPTLTVVSNTAHQVTSSSPQLTPVLSEMQVARITLGAEKIAAQLPRREPRAHTSKKRTSRELEQVIAMNENDPRRMDEIRKYSAIYGRFDCKRRPEKPLTLHEVCVNEAAAQLCRLVPALLTRRDELFPLARQIVKDAGFGHSATIARYGNLLSQMSQAQTSTPQTRSVTAMLDCESSDTNMTPSKRQRLSSSDASLNNSDSNRDSLEDPRYNLFAMYQKFAAKPPFDLADIAKFTLNKPSEIEEQDQESRFSFSNSSSPSIPVKHWTRRAGGGS